MNFYDNIWRRTNASKGWSGCANRLLQDHISGELLSASCGDVRREATTRSPTVALLDARSDRRENASGEHGETRRPPQNAQQ